VCCDAEIGWHLRFHPNPPDRVGEIEDATQSPQPNKKHITQPNPLLTTRVPTRHRQCDTMQGRYDEKVRSVKRAIFSFWNCWDVMKVLLPKRLQKTRWQRRSPNGCTRWVSVVGLELEQAAAAADRERGGLVVIR